MAERDLILLIDKPVFQVKLRSNLLEVDLKEGMRKRLEDVVEADPFFQGRGLLGLLFQTIIPLDIPLHEIESIETDDKGNVKVKIPDRRDLHIPLEPEEALKLVNKINELIPAAKKKEFERISEIWKDIGALGAQFPGH